MWKTKRRKIIKAKRAPEFKHQYQKKKKKLNWISAKIAQKCDCV
jgi:hypothetical protein